MFKPQPYLFALLACVACAGSKFEAAGSAGTDGSGASAGASTAGASTAGADTAGSAGDSSAGGAGQGGAGQGGAGQGGAGQGGAGQGGAAGLDCATLKVDYAALVKKAHVCDQGSTDECTTASKAPAVGCGCPTLLNAKSEYTAEALAKYKAIEDGNCDNGVTCNIACLPVTSASCAQSTGTGTSEFVCSGVSGGIAQ